jgi:hypothetical protein
MSTDTLQAMTAAVSPSGLTAYVRHFVNTTYAAHLDGQAAPDDVFFADRLTLSPWNFIQGYRAELRNGRISGAQTRFDSVTSQGGGNFTVVLTAAANVAYGIWHEMGLGVEGFRQEPFENRLANFTFSIANLQLTFKVAVASSGGQWSFTISAVSQSAFGVSNVSIPRGSRLLSGGEDWLNSLFGCVSNTVAERVRDHLRTEQFTTAAEEAMRADLLTIANSGQLTPGITYEYHPHTMSFPDGGIAFGANGAVTFKDKGGTVAAYPGTIPPPLALPAVDPARHVNFYVHQYDFDALLWGFLRDGDLTMRVTRGMLVDGAPLETNTYRDSPLHALYEKYPGHDLTMAITALTAPTVVFNGIYMITDDALRQIAGTKQVPQAVLDKLGEMVNIVLPDQAAFLDKLSQYIGDDSVRLYKDVIVKYAVAMAAVVTYEFQYDIDVVDKGQAVRVMRIKIDEYDFLENLALSSRAATQTVTFQFKAGATTAVTLVETSLPGIQPCDPKNLFGCVFTQIWRQVLKPKVSEVLASIGTTGVPLPFIKGFLFVDDVVTLQPTYARIDTNIKFA